MDLDPTVIIPAILFTVVAIYLASSLLSKKPDAAASSSAGNKKPKVDYRDDIPQSRALTEEPEASPQPEPPASPVEDIGAAETIQDVPVLQVKSVPVSAPELVLQPVKRSEPVLEPLKAPEPVPEPVKVLESVREPFNVPKPVEALALVPDPLTAQEVAAITEPTPELVSVPEPVPKPAAIQEPVSVLKNVPQSAAVPEPVSVPEPVPEVVSVPKSIPEREQLANYEPGSEAFPQPSDGTERNNEESLPELITGSTEDSLLTPEPVVEASPLPEFEPDQETILNDDEAAAENKVMFTLGKKQSKFETLMTKEEIEEEQRAPE